MGHGWDMERADLPLRALGRGPPICLLAGWALAIARRTVAHSGAQLTLGNVTFADNKAPNGVRRGPCRSGGCRARGVCPRPRGRHPAPPPLRLAQAAFYCWATKKSLPNGLVQATTAYTC